MLLAAILWCDHKWQPIRLPKRFVPVQRAAQPLADRHEILIMMNPSRVSHKTRTSICLVPENLRSCNYWLHHFYMSPVLQTKVDVETSVLYHMARGVRSTLLVGSRSSSMIDRVTRMSYTGKPMVKNRGEGRERERERDLVYGGIRVYVRPARIPFTRSRATNLHLHILYAAWTG